MVTFARRAVRHAAPQRTATVLACIAGLFVGCGDDAKPAGKLVISLQTNMSLPDDVDVIRLDVERSGRPLLSETFEFEPQPDILLPATIGLLGGEDPTAPVNVTVSASQGGALRTLRKITTTIPSDRAALLRVPIDWFCYDVENTPGGELSIDYRCTEGTTCVAGECVDQDVDSRTLPDYAPEDVFGGGTEEGNGECFDTLACFSDGVAADVDLDACSIDGVTRQTSVALLGLPGTRGICAPSYCLIPLDAESDFGWREEDGKLQMPRAVCQRLLSDDNLIALVTTTACEQKTESLPTCGPWSSITGRRATRDAGLPENVSVDAGPGGGAAGGIDGGGGSTGAGGATGMGGTPGMDAAVVDASTQCTSHGDCAGLLCDVELGRCVECVRNNDCTGGHACSGSVCVATPDAPTGAGGAGGSEGSAGTGTGGVRDAGNADAKVEGGGDSSVFDGGPVGGGDASDGSATTIPFLLLATETPFGGGTDGDVLRYLVHGTFGSVEELAPIPGEALHDPAGVAVWNGETLYVANRWGNDGNGTIDRIAFDGVDFAIIDSTSGNGLESCHQVAIDRAHDELFQTNWTANVLSRFTIGVAGALIENGVIQMPDSDYQLGVVVRPADSQLFVSDYDRIRRFARNGDGSYTFAGYFGSGAGQQYHYMSFLDDELYIGAFTSNEVERYSFDDNGAPVYKDAIPANGALNAAFSPDGQEMFVANHASGGIARFRYDPLDDTWTPHGDVVQAPVLGAVTTLPLAQ